MPETPMAALPPIVHAHAEDYFAQRWKPHTWVTRETQHGTRLTHCSYCGSLPVAHALRLLQTPGTKYSGSDWKYGWPHKFYVGEGKFYATHLRDATPEELRAWERVATPLLGVAFIVATPATDGLPRLGYRAPHHGFQRWGFVGRAPAEETAPPRSANPAFGTLANAATRAVDPERPL